MLIECHSTQKLCVRFDSIKTPVGDRYHGGDHFVLASSERQLTRHQHAKLGEGMIECLGNQAVRTDNPFHSVGLEYWRLIFLWIQHALRFEHAQKLLVGFGQGDGLNPGHRGSLEYREYRIALLARTNRKVLSYFEFGIREAVFLRGCR